MIDGTPKVVRFSVDLDEDFIKVPAPSREVAAMDALLSDFCREHWAEPVPPALSDKILGCERNFTRPRSRQLIYSIRLCLELSLETLKPVQPDSV